jgi:hypothetical protein
MVQTVDGSLGSWQYSRELGRLNELRITLVHQRAVMVPGNQGTVATAQCAKDGTAFETDLWKTQICRQMTFLSMGDGRQMGKAACSLLSPAVFVSEKTQNDQLGSVSGLHLAQVEIGLGQY